MINQIKKKIDNNKFYSSVAIYVFSNGISAISPFLLLPIMTKYLTPSEFGAYSIFLLLVTSFTLLVGVNINGCLNVNYFKISQLHYPVFVTSCFFLATLSLVFFLLIYFFVGEYFSEWFNVEPWLLLCSIFLGFFNVVLISCLAIMQAANKAVDFLKLKMTQVFFDVSLSLIFLLLLVYGFLGRVYSYAAAISIAAIFAIVYLLKNNFFGSSISSDYCKKAIIFGLPLLPHTLSGSIIMFTDRLVISNFIGLDSVGIYMAGLQISMIMLLLVEPVNKAYAPWLFKKLSSVNFNDSSGQIVKNTYCYFIFLVFFAFSLYMINDLLFYILIDENFYAIKPNMLFLYLGFAFQGMYYTVANYVLHSEKTGVLSLGTGSAAMLGVLTSITLVSNFGIAGAAISFMLTNFYLFLIVWWISKRYVDMPWFSPKKWVEI